MVASCALSNDPPKEGATEEALNLASIKFTTEGILDYETTVFGENPTTLLEPKDFHGFEFDNTMLHIGSMNMLLHGVDQPDIRYRDSLCEGATGDAGEY